jgi:hypothetical protein
VRSRTEPLLFDDAPGDLDELLEEIDAALDASFLGDVKAALERAGLPADDASAPAAA